MTTLKITDAFEEPPLLVCLLSTMASPFTDNVQGICSRCARSVQHRPHVPQPATLLCIECFVKEHPDGLPAEIHATTKTLLEVLKHERETAS
jgi:hypothetical protein